MHAQIICYAPPLPAYLAGVRRASALPTAYLADIYRPESFPMVFGTRPTNVCAHACHNYIGHDYVGHNYVAHHYTGYNLRQESLSHKRGLFSSDEKANSMALYLWGATWPSCRLWHGLRVILWPVALQLGPYHGYRMAVLALCLGLWSNGP